MATLDELIQQLDVLKADDKMDREERSDKMRKIRRQIRKLGGRLRESSPPGQASLRRSSRSKRREIRTFKTRTEEEMTDFTKDFMRRLKAVHPEIEFTKVSVTGRYHAFPANLLMDDMETAGASLEEIIEMSLEKYYSRWGVYPEARAVFMQGEIPVLCYGYPPLVPGPNTPIFRQNSGNSW